MLERWRARVGWRTWLLGVALFAGFIAVVLPAEAARTAEAIGSSGSPDSSYLYGPSDLMRFASEYGPEGRAYYIRSRFTFDIAWPLVYGLFLQSSLVLAARHTVLRRLPAPLVFAPAFAVLFDLLENTAASIVMARYPDATPVLPFVAPVATFLKWNLIGSSFALAAVGALAGVVQLVRRLAQRGER